MNRCAAFPELRNPKKAEKYFFEFFGSLKIRNFTRPLDVILSEVEKSSTNQDKLTGYREYDDTFLTNSRILI